MKNTFIHITTYILLLTSAAFASFAQSQHSIHNVRDFGAIGDGKAIETDAIHQAITACSENAGQVYFPPGDYLSGTIHLKSNIAIVLDTGARLIGSASLELYQNFNPPAEMPESRWTRWHRALMLLDGVENVTISGKGTIDGNKVFDPQGEEKIRGPHTIIIGNSRNVLIRDLWMKDSANYHVMIENSHQVEVRNVKFTGGWDGVHFRGWKDHPCHDISIVGCEFYTGDDAIAGRFWQNTLIKDCIINSSCNGIRLIGPAQRLIIQNCLFYGPGVYPHRTSDRYNMLAAINLQPGAWDPTEGRMDDVLISDITMHNVASPFHIVLNPGNTAGKINISRVNATGVYRSACSVESWAETAFENVTFRDVNIEFDGGGKPDPNRLDVRKPGVDARPLPAWGFYARNVRNLRLEDVSLSYVDEDLRPVMICEDVESLTLNDFDYSRSKGAPDLFLFKEVKHIHLHDADIPNGP